MERIKFVKQEQGQSIVIIAIAMVAMLALAGLAIDGGNLFLERRNTQNAADAAALAGTRVLAEAVCSHDGIDDSTILAAVDQFAGRNGVEDVSMLFAEYTDQQENVLGEVGAGTIPVGASGVQVNIDNTFDTHFMKVVGIDTADVSADALALTGPLGGGGGLRPVGVPLEFVEGIPMGGGVPFRLNFGNCEQKPLECIIAWTGGETQHRGWLNLGYMWNDGTWRDESLDNWPRAIDPNADANILKEWMANGWNDSTMYVGDYVHAKPGRDSSVIGQAPVDEVIVVPIFDSFPPYEEIPSPKPPKANQGSGDYYHVIGFLAFEVTGKSQGGGWIDGTVVEVIMGNGQVGYGKYIGFGEGNACRTHIQAVNLWR